MGKKRDATGETVVPTSYDSWKTASPDDVNPERDWRCPRLCSPRSSCQECWPELAKKAKGE